MSNKDKIITELLEKMQQYGMAGKNHSDSVKVK